jgi:hypothetical protein
LVNEVIEIYLRNIPVEEDIDIAGGENRLDHPVLYITKES